MSFMSHNDLVKFITFIVLLLNNTPSLNCLSLQAMS